MNIKGLAVYLILLLSIRSMAQSPIESAVRGTLSFAPRSSAKASTTNISAADLIKRMGFSGGNLICIGDARDRSASWSFAHRMPSSLKGESFVDTNLSDKFSIEVLGYSEVGVVKPPSSTAPSVEVFLGKVISNQTVKLAINLNDGFVGEFWGSLLVNYKVTQEAGSLVSSWLPGNLSMRLVGWSSSGGAQEGSASLTLMMGAFKRAYRDPASATNELDVLTVRADVDHESIIEISPLGIRWENKGWGNRPGTLDGAGEVATKVNGTDWFAKWPDGTTRSEGFSSYANFKPGFFKNSVQVAVLSSRMGKDVFQIVQQPTAENNYTLRILLMDYWGGSDWHEIRVSALK